MDRDSGAHSGHRWLIFGLMYLLMVIFALSFQFLPPVLDILKKEISLSAHQSGFLMGSNVIPGLLIPLFIPRLAKRLNVRRLLLVSLLIIIAGNAVIALSSTFYPLVTGRIVAGIGGAILLTVPPLVVMSLFPGSVGKAIGFFNTGVPVGSLLALNLFGITSHHWGWRGTTWMIVVVAAAAAGALLFPLDIPGEEPGEGLKGGGQHSRFGGVMWMLFSLWLVMNAQTIGYNVFAPSFYQQLGFRQQAAKTLTSLYIVETVVINPIVGWLIDRWGMRKLILVAGNLLMAVSFFLIPETDFNPVLWGLAFGAGAALIPVTLFGVLAAHIPQDSRGRAISLLVIGSNLGSVSGSFLFGEILDLSGMFAGSFWIFAGLSLAMIPIALKIPGSWKD